MVKLYTGVINCHLVYLRSEKKSYNDISDDTYDLDLASSD